MSDASYLSMFIPTCSKYFALSEVLLPRLLDLIKSTSLNIPIYLSTDDTGIISSPLEFRDIYILQGQSKNKEWASLTSNNLQKVPSEYVLLWLDDLIPTNYMVNELSLQDCLDHVRNENLDCLRIVTFFNKTASRAGFDFYFETLSSYMIARGSSIYHLPMLSPYRFSLIPSIWKRSSLIKLLEANKNMSPWQLEKRLTIPSDLETRFSSVSRSVVGIQNLVVKGKLWPRFAKKLKLPHKVTQSFDRMSRIQRFLFNMNLAKHIIFLCLIYFPFLLWNVRSSAQN